MADATDPTTPQRPIGQSALNRATSLARVVVRRSIASGRKLRRLSSVGRTTTAVQRVVQRSERSSTAISGKGIGSLTPELAANFAERVAQRAQPNAQGVLRRALQPADPGTADIQRMEMPLLGEGASTSAPEGDADEGIAPSAPAISAAEMLTRINSGGSNSVFRSAAESNPIPPGSTPESVKALVAQRAAQNRSAVQRTTAEPLAPAEKIREARENSPRPSPGLVRRFSRVEERTQLQQALMGAPTPAPANAQSAPVQRSPAQQAPVQRAPAHQAPTQTKPESASVQRLPAQPTANAPQANRINDAAPPDAPPIQRTAATGVAPQVLPSDGPQPPVAGPQPPTIRRVPRATRTYVGEPVQRQAMPEPQAAPEPDSIQRAPPPMPALPADSAQSDAPAPTEIQRSAAAPQADAAPDTGIDASVPESDMPVARSAAPAPSEPQVQRQPAPPSATPSEATPAQPPRMPAPSRAAIRRAIAQTSATPGTADVQRAPETPPIAAPEAAQTRPDAPVQRSTPPHTPATPRASAPPPEIAQSAEATDTRGIQRTVQRAPAAQTQDAQRNAAPVDGGPAASETPVAQQPPPAEAAATAPDMPVLRRKETRPDQLVAAGNDDDASPATDIARSVQPAAPQPQTPESPRASAASEPPAIRRSPATESALPADVKPSAPTTPPPTVMQRAQLTSTPPPPTVMRRVQPATAPPSGDASPNAGSPANETRAQSTRRGGALPVRQMPAGQTPVMRAPLAEPDADIDNSPAAPPRVQRAAAPLAVSSPVSTTTEAMVRRASARNGLARKALPALQMPLTQRAATPLQTAAVTTASTGMPDDATPTPQVVQRAALPLRPINPFEQADATEHSLPLRREVTRVIAVRDVDRNASSASTSAQAGSTPAVQRATQPAVQRAGKAPQIQRVQDNAPVQPTGSDEESGLDQPAQAADLDALARQLLPHIKRMVRHERERMFGR